MATRSIAKKKKSVSIPCILSRCRLFYAFVVVLCWEGEVQIFRLGCKFQVFLMPSFPFSPLPGECRMASSFGGAVVRRSIVFWMVRGHRWPSDVQQLQNISMRWRSVSQVLPVLEEFVVPFRGGLSVCVCKC
jgi:hypothetical protein